MVVVLRCKNHVRVDDGRRCFNRRWFHNAFSLRSWRELGGSVVLFWQRSREKGGYTSQFENPSRLRHSLRVAAPPPKKVVPRAHSRCASRHSTNQNASFVDWFSRLERAVFRGTWGEMFALFQACVGNFDTIPPWESCVNTYLDSTCVTFKYFAFLSVCDKFELLGHVQAAMMILF